MKRFVGLVLGLSLLAACNDIADPAYGPDPGEAPEFAPPSKAIFDGVHEGGNSDFFFLPPLVPNPQGSPEYDAGKFDPTLSLVVEICEADNQGCLPTSSQPAGFPITFSTETGSGSNRIKVSGEQYHVNWKTKSADLDEDRTYRIRVLVQGTELGFADVDVVKSGKQLKNVNTDEFVALKNGRTLPIKFRIEERALEQAFCDAQGLEDCDVEPIDDETGGTVRVFEDPGSAGEVVAAVVELPAESAQLDGEPIDDYVVILELEEAGATQSGDVPPSQQVPYLIDVRTEPAGVTFNLGGPGVQVTLCQDPDALASIPEALHDQLIIFKVNGGTTELLPTTLGAGECEGYQLASNSRPGQGDSGETDGLFRRFLTGISRVAELLQPSPLYAMFLHGGLNTIIFDFSELGAILDVDPFSSTAVVPNGEVGSPTEILVMALNGLGGVFPFGGDVVEVSVTGANTATPTVADNGDGTYSASYTPIEAGTDQVAITINGYAIAGSPYPSEVAGLMGSITVSVEVSEEIPVPLENVEIGLYDLSSETPVFVTSGTSAGDPAQVTFEDLDYGDYAVQVMGGYDIDIEFDLSDEYVTLETASESVTFTGDYQELPTNARVWRIADGGNGNAYEFMKSSDITWTASHTAAQTDLLFGVGGHLATTPSAAENALVNSLKNVNGGGGMRAWIGLTDEIVEGDYRWVTGETFIDSNWSVGEPNNLDPHPYGPEDYVEMFSNGTWNDIGNNNGDGIQGYIVEWEVSDLYPAPLDSY